MAVSDYSGTPADNTSINGIDISEGCAPSGINNAIRQMMADVFTDRTPVGVILPYGGTTAPDGWALCYGQAVSRTTYATLFTALGTTYGDGDGSTTFNVPDMRGRVPAGRDSMGTGSANRLTGQPGGVNGDVLGNTGGAETHTLTEAQMPNHTHSVPRYDEFVSVQSGGSHSNTWRGPASVASGSAGSGAAHNNVQPTIILNYIIKLA